MEIGELQSSGSRLQRAESSLLAAQSLQFELDYGQKLVGEGRSPDAERHAATRAL